MNRRNFLKTLSILLGVAVVHPVGETIPSQGTIGAWQGVRWVHRYKRFEFPSVLGEGEMWSYPQLEMERVQTTYDEYQAALHPSDYDDLR